MKNIFTWCLAVLALATACAQQDNVHNEGNSVKGKGPEEVVKIQGVPVDILYGNQPAITRSAYAYEVSFDDIQYWAGSGSKQAAVIIKFNDAIAPEAMVWGYRFDADSISSYEMLTEIAKADSRMQVLVQYQGISYGYDLGWGLGAIGFNHAANGGRFDVELNWEAAADDSRVKFHYTGTPNSEVGQTSVPSNPEREIENAVDAGILTGVIEHPFNYGSYGYPAYDFDYWTIAGSTSNKSWASGWNEAYWAFYIKEGADKAFTTASTGVYSHYVKDGYIDGFYFCDTPAAWPCGNMDGPYTYVTAPNK